MQAVLRLIIATVVPLCGVVWAANAQQSGGVVVRVEPRSLLTGRTAVLHVTLEIPPDRFVPAETIGALRGAWVQTTTGLLLDFEGATYPIPAEVTLPGADRAVLAYSGRVPIRLPVEVGFGSSGPVEVEVRAGFQTCTPDRCNEFRMQTARQTMTISEPARPDVSLAFRVDEAHVAVMTDATTGLDTTVPQRTITTAFVGRLGTLPATDAPPAAPRSWTIRSPRRTYHAQASQTAALIGTACGVDMPVVDVARISAPQFTAERAKYFLASRAFEPRNRLAPVESDVRLTAAQRLELESLLERQRRLTAPALIAPDPRVSEENQPREREYDRRLRAGEGRLTYHVESFRLAPDGVTRLFVRAFWTAAGEARTGLTLWIRFDGRTFTVERANANISQLARFDDMFVPNVAASSLAAGQLVAVVPDTDGWAFVVLANVGYESQSVVVWKYSADGPVTTGARYSAGC